MNRLLDAIGRERRARVFLAAYAQSALGTGAATVGLIVIAYERYRSPWAITLVLLASLFPPGILGPLFGAAIDRYSRRTCLVVADLIRVAAFAGIGLVHGIAPTVALAFLAGTGTALYSPAALAALPSLVERERLPAVTSLYGAINDAGRALGPLTAAVAFPLVGTSGVMFVNAATFAISACVLALLPFGGAVEALAPRARGSFMREVREGLRETARIPVVRVIVAASTLVFVFAGLLNVAELLVARALGASSSQFALLLAAQGAGIVAGSLSGARRGRVRDYESRYLTGALAAGVALLGIAGSASLGPAFAAFVLLGLGNGLVVVHERLIFQVLVPERLMGRAFSVLEGLGSWAFAVAYLAGAALVAGIGARGCLVVAGGGVLLVTAGSALALRRQPALAHAAVDAESG